MNEDPPFNSERRGKPGRRKEDRILLDQLRRYHQLYQVGQVLTSEMNLETLFEVIIDQTNAVMGTERGTVFLFDENTNTLWSLVASGMGKDLIRIPADKGVAGWVFQQGQAALINDAYVDPRFYPDVDRETGFRTRNILCVPLINRSHRRIGALQALNKNGGEFTGADVELLTSISHYVAIALENARLYEDLKLMEKARERVINHLSHELKTPLAVIGAALHQMGKKLRDSRVEGYETVLKRGKRSIQRLLNLQEKIDDILNRKAVLEKETLTKIIEDAAFLVEESMEENGGMLRQSLEAVLQKVEDLYAVDPVILEEIDLSRSLTHVHERMKAQARNRNLNVHYRIEDGLWVPMDRKVLDKVLEGILKNAVENTPDEGDIEITARRGPDGVQVEIRDAGIGISAQNQKLIFHGFIHMSDTALYSSKKPYDFGAGGAGSDLLRIKLFSERFGFDVSFKSTRCPFLPKDGDLCPGRISNCPHVESADQCRKNGGTAFTLLFQPRVSLKTQPEQKGLERLARSPDPA